MRYPKPLVFAVLLAVGLPVMGCAACVEATKKTEERRVISEQQQAILDYSEKVPEVDTLQRAFVEAWRKANELKDVKALKEAFEAKVVPALEAYVEALRGMPVGTEKLEQIHQVVADAVGGTVAVFKEYTEGLSEDNLEARYKKILGAMDGVAKAEEQYYQQLAEYYAANKVKLQRDDGKK